MNELAAHVKDIFSPLGTVSLRRMFGGYGIFHAGLMFGLVFDGTVYLKADEQNLPAFEALGLEQFTYVRQGKRVGLSYYRAPDQLFDEPEEAGHWARHAFAAAVRAGSRSATR